MTALPAADHPATASAVRHMRRSGRLLVLAGVLLLAVFLVVVTVVGEVNDRLREEGTRTTGTVERTTPDTGHGSGSAEVTFRAGARTVAAVVHLGADVDGYAVGQRVTVYYDVADPHRMTVDDEDNQPAWTVPPMVVSLVAGVGCLVAAVVLAVRRRRTLGILRLGPWQAARAAVRTGKNEAVFVLPGGDAWRYTGPTAWPGGDPLDQELWWVDDGRRAVFSPDRGRPLLLARRRRRGIRRGTGAAPGVPARGG